MLCSLRSLSPCRCAHAQVDEQAKTVTLSNGETLPYDALVIATGSLGPKTFGAALAPTAAADIEAVYKQRQAAIAAAKVGTSMGQCSVQLNLQLNVLAL
jgi:NAD(P)H-nitrite reductase large subunit